jgi:hypothetical protein
MTSTPNYKSRFSMPVIAPPPAAQTDDPAGYYASLNATVSITPTTHDGGLRIEISPLAQAPLYAIFSGLVHYLPPNAPLPGSTLVAPAKGALVLRVSLPDFSKSLASFPPGTPCISTILYLGVEQASVATALLPEVQKIGAAGLKHLWATTHSGNPPPGTDFAADFLGRVLAGSVGVFVDGGVALGNAATVSPTSAAFELRVMDAATPKAYLSPLGLLLGATSYGF